MVRHCLRRPQPGVTHEHWTSNREKLLQVHVSNSDQLSLGTWARALRPSSTVSGDRRNPAHLRSCPRPGSNKESCGLMWRRIQGLRYPCRVCALMPHYQNFEPVSHGRVNIMCRIQLRKEDEHNHLPQRCRICGIRETVQRNSGREDVYWRIGSVLRGGDRNCLQTARIFASEDETSVALNRTGDISSLRFVIWPFFRARSGLMGAFVIFFFSEREVEMKVSVRVTRTEKNHAFWSVPRTSLRDNSLSAPG